MALNNSSSINNNPEDIHVLSQDKYKIFGVYWDKTSSPTMTRTDDAVGATSVVGVDNQLITTNDFDDFPIWRDMVEVKDSYGNSFIKIPKFYIQRKSGKGFLQVRVSQYQHPGFYLPKVFWDHENHRELPYYLMGVCLGGYSSDDLRLESKKGFMPAIGNSLHGVRVRARANNVNGLKGYQLHDIHSQDVISTLWMVEHANVQSRPIMKGAGGLVDGNDKVTVTVAETGTNRAIVSNAHADLFVVGQTLTVAGVDVGQITSIETFDATNKALNYTGTSVTTAIGTALGSSAWKSGFSSNILPSNGSVTSNTDDKHPNVYRGIESPWSDALVWCDGVSLQSAKFWVSENPNEYGDITKYKQLAYPGNTPVGIIMEMGFDPDFPYAQLPIKVGSNAGYYGSGYKGSGLGERVALIGGWYSGGDDNGINKWEFYSSPSSTGHFSCGRLIKKAIGE